MNRIFTLVAFIAISFFASAQSKTATSSNLNQIGTGTLFIGSSTSISTNDNNYLTAALPRGGASQTLQLTNFNFNLPENAIVSGIEVNIESRAATSGRITPTIIQLMLGGSVIGENKASSTTTISNIDELQTYGSENDKWTVNSLNRNNFSDPSFGIAISFQNNNANNNNPNTIYIDYVSVTVYYSVAATLPVNFISFNAKKEGSNTKLNWNVAQQDNVARYEVERSSNGTSFSKIGQVAASDITTYSFVDAQPVLGTVYYRVKNVDNDGKFKYSTVISLKEGSSLAVLKAFPLPAKNNVTLQHGNAINASQIRISAQDGRQLKTIRPAVGTMQTTIDLTSFTPGLYILSFDNGSGQVETIKIVKQ